MTYKKSGGYLLLVAAIVLFAQLIPLPDGLTRPALNSIVLLLSAIFLWVVKALPVAITAFLFTTLMPFFGIIELNTVFTRIGNSTFFSCWRRFASQWPSRALPSHIVCLFV